ncbi:DUF6502 family protein [Bosea sp. CS1GBMeth4]|uniref:DUF6502 family protein n=1 Tax=Bosea sp. CS1GBMeth4 TaxID=1892849 RepID=UPI001645423B|nr:DUF6502 family protein [Bosea sp. CS1GBMeth4]
MTDAAPGPTAEKLYLPLARLLRPLVRLCIRAGMTFPALCQLLRELYVNVAEYDFALPGKEQTDSRVSLLTGIHRKEVSRLRGAGAPVNAVPAAVSRTGAIIARWLGSPRFCDAAGAPLPLPRNADGSSPSFEELVSSVTRDVRPRAVLDEWLDRRVVTIDPKDRIVLAEAAFIPQHGDDEKLYYFGRNLHDHVAAAAENVLGSKPAFVERSVHYDGLSAELAEKLEARSRELALEMLQRINREAHAACETDRGGEHRWNCGVYVFRERDGRAGDESGQA